ncbi:hypothetical protein HD553DRAFT_323539 [Filobasidium floriforme]|uniref:uncharacterized protein n=1 Tax=Filobasidium floriforme TaxID=5210 RepID=UPI001E8D87D3|nr:uncharacterized protein HD553DRAFT_323539 [Filobasidium floriforme]KAH8085678.1 hypothetical protein HD553DRAFT_323539 [Filobasidium floriforme]
MSGNPYGYYVPPTEDQNQIFTGESQQPSSTDFPQNTPGQSSFGGNPYTMKYLPPTNPTDHNMSPSLSNWTGAFDDPTQDPYVGSSYGYGEYPPLQSHQQPVFDANSYPDYQNPSVYPYDDDSAYSTILEILWRAHILRRRENGKYFPSNSVWALESFFQGIHRPYQSAGAFSRRHTYEEKKAAVLIEQRESSGKGSRNRVLYLGKARKMARKVRALQEGDGRGVERSQE